MTPAATLQEWEDLLRQGVLRDLGGRALRRFKCRWCGGQTVGETCPQSLPCPSCHATRGDDCVSPGDTQWHTERVDAARRRDEQREKEGDLSLPKRWTEQSK